MTTTPPVDLSDLPADMNPELVNEIREARLKTIQQEGLKLHAEAELRHQKTLGQRYKEWAQDDTIGRDLALAFEPRGKTA